MKIVIDIPEELYKANLRGLEAEELWDLRVAIKNGTPLDKHDEEIIATTVESIWGKPPYTELLDKIRAEIEEYKSRQLTLAIGVDDFEKGKQIALEYILAVIDKYKAESEDKQ